MSSLLCFSACSKSRAGYVTRTRAWGKSRLWWLQFPPLPPADAALSHTHQVLKNLNFQPVLNFRATFCVVSLVNCVLFTHIMKWEGTHLKKKKTYAVAETI